MKQFINHYKCFKNLLFLNVALSCGSKSDYHIQNSIVFEECDWKGWTVVNCFDFLIFSVNWRTPQNKLTRKTVINKLHKVIIFSIFNEETFGISTPKTVTINKPYKGKYIFPLLLTLLLIYGISIDLPFISNQHTIIKHNLKITIAPTLNLE